MKLQELECFDVITIQCHNNPDADAIGSGFGLYRYFQSKGKKVRLIYSGNYRIRKKNLQLMISNLHIPIEYVRPHKEQLEGLLITVDCQYGAGNVTQILADNIAIIDHHQKEGADIQRSEIRANMGSCSTLVWKLLKEENYPVNGDKELGTALLYGLYTDTNQFTEVYSPLDMDMRESLPYDLDLLNRLRYSNLTLEELEIAGIAMIRHVFNEKHQYAIIKAQPCDPNILGIISDFLIQVDEVKSCVVYNEQDEGYKFSVRSCDKKVKSNELAEYIAEKIGSGGGRLEKSGGFVSKALYEKKYPSLLMETYFSERIKEYFENTQVIYAREFQTELGELQLYHKKKLPIGYVKATDVLPNSTPVTIRTMEGDVDMLISPDLYIMLGRQGEVYTLNFHKFSRKYKALETIYQLSDYETKQEYHPAVKSRVDASSRFLSDYAKECLERKDIYVYAILLKKRTKVFGLYDENTYMLGEKGDFLLVREDNPHDIYIVKKDIFYKTYE